MELVLNPEHFWQPFLAVVLSFIIAQGAKVLLDIIAKRPVNLLENGGMPSSHSATVMSLLIVVLFEEGLSLLFLTVLVFTIIVINDAVGVRQETSKHSTFLNDLINKKQFRIVGHKPFEVFIGCVIGLLVPFFLYVL